MCNGGCSDGVFVPKRPPRTGDPLDMPARPLGALDTIGPSQRVGSGRTVLVADDDEALRETMADILAIEGYDVLQAADGEEALAQVLLHDSVDVLILDMAMPKRDGLSVLEDLGPAPPKVIVLSAFAYYGPEDIDRMGLGRKITRSLRKPVPPVRLLAAISEAVEELDRDTEDGPSGAERSQPR